MKNSAQNPNMTGRVLAALFCLLFLTGAVERSRPLPAPSSARPHLVLIVVDTLRADHVSAYGYSRKTTPRMDAFAEESWLFENAIAQTSWTTPSMASIWTGLGTESHATNALKTQLPVEFPVMAEVLQSQGYRTAAFVSNSLAGRRIGFDRGFEYYREFPERHRDQGKYASSAEVNDRVLEFIDQTSFQEPWFIYIHYTDPHEPYMPAERGFSNANEIVLNIEEPLSNKTIRSYLRGPKRQQVLQEIVNLYDDEIRVNDERIGHVLDRLRDRGLMSEAWVVMTSDHGEAFHEHDTLGHRRTLYEPEIHVPLIIRSPEGRPRRIAGLMRHIDYMPTLLGLMGLEIPPGLDGRNAAAENFAHMAPETRVYLERGKPGTTARQIFGVRTPEAKLIYEYRREPQFRWTDKAVEFDYDGLYLELHAGSYRQSRTVRILADGVEVLRDQVAQQRRVMPVTFEDSRRRRIRVESTEPCELTDFQDRECLSFRIFSTSSIDLDRLQGVLAAETREFYDLQRDPAEQSNIYADKRGSRDLTVIETSMRHFIGEHERDRGSGAPVEFNAEQVEILKSLGYLQ